MCRTSCLRSSTRTFTFQFTVGQRQWWSTSHVRRQCLKSPTPSLPRRQCLNPPAPVEEYISHTPAVFPATAPVIENISPAPAVSQPLAPVLEFISPRASSVSSDSASDRVHFTRASRVPRRQRQWWSISHPCQPCSPATAPVVEYFSPVPAVFPGDSASGGSISHPRQPCLQATAPSAVAGGDSQGSVPGQSSTARGGAVARGRGLQGPVPPLIAELFALGELPPEARTDLVSEQG